jgi:hypothetical protein
MAAQLHFAENALALHLFFQRLEGLVDVVITDKNLHACSSCIRFWDCMMPHGQRPAPPWRGL